MKISASIQASNIYNLLNELNEYSDSFDQLHVDITDGNFTNNISLPVAIIEYIKKNTDYVIDTHLMLNNNELLHKKLLNMVLILSLYIVKLQLQKSLNR